MPTDSTSLILVILYWWLYLLMIWRRLNLSISLVELFENTIEVWLFDKGRNAIGPFFVKIWLAILFSTFLWSIIAVWAKDL